MKKNVLMVLIIFSLVTNTTIISLAQSLKPPYEIIISGDGFTYFEGKNYHSVSIFLNNNTNDTLNYQGSDCHNILFNLKNNLYFHLSKDICKNKSYLKVAIPPHRSQKLQVFLTMDKEPDRNILLQIDMTLYKWTEKERQRKEKLFGRLSGKIIMRYNSKRQPYWLPETAYALNKREKKILPNKDIYLLTDDDRKKYTLTIAESEITKPRDTISRYNGFKKNKVANVPVTFHNNSADTVRFYSMSCSWYEFWDTNQSNISVSGWDCFKNVRDIIEIAPHQDYKKTLNIVYNTTVKHGTKYKISMSLLKVTDYEKLGWNFWPNEYTHFNKIWSNDIYISSR